jgi:hypothetical protein
MSSPTNSRRGHLETSDTKNRYVTFLCCPQCRETYQIKSIDQFLDCKRLIWHMLLMKIEDGVRKQRIIGTLAVCDARETMLQKIDREGILVSRCLHCLLDFSRPFLKDERCSKLSILLPHMQPLQQIN